MDGNATQRSTTKTASAILAPISHVARISTAQARVITPLVTGSHALHAWLTAALATTAEAAAAPVRDHAQAALTSQTTHRTRARALSIRTTADGAAIQSSIIRMVNVTAAPNKHVRQVLIGQAGVTTRAEMATRVQLVWPTVAQASIAVGASPRMQARVRTARTHHKMRTT